MFWLEREIWGGERERNSVKLDMLYFALTVKVKEEINWFIFKSIYIEELDFIYIREKKINVITITTTWL